MGENVIPVEFGLERTRKEMMDIQKINRRALRKHGPKVEAAPPTVALSVEELVDIAHDIRESRLELGTDREFYDHDDIKWMEGEFSAGFNELTPEQQSDVRQRVAELNKTFNKTKEV